MPDSHTGLVIRKDNWSCILILSSQMGYMEEKYKAELCVLLQILNLKLILFFRSLMLFLEEHNLKTGGTVSLNAINVKQIIRLHPFHKPELHRGA